MKNGKKYIFIIIIVCVTVACMIFWFKGKPVENKEQAIEIAKAYVLEKYHKSFDDYNISVEPEGELWIVSYGIPPVYDESGEIVAAPEGGGGPALKIEKSSGKVISCLLQK